ncbi:MAG TPA: hypothetical protein VGM46_12495 [Mesorhizobium sp.]
MTAKNHRSGQEKLAADIKRDIGSGNTARLLHASPAFKPAADLPDYLKHLLDQLKEVRPPKANARVEKEHTRHYAR